MFLEHYEIAKTHVVTIGQQLFSTQKRMLKAESWMWEGNLYSGGSIQGEKERYYYELFLFFISSSYTHAVL